MSGKYSLGKVLEKTGGKTANARAITEGKPMTNAKLSGLDNLRANEPCEFRI